MGRFRVCPFQSGEKYGEYEVALWKSLAFLDDADLHTTVVLLRNDARRALIYISSLGTSRAS